MTKYLNIAASIFLAFVLFSCGPGAEEKALLEEAGRATDDSIKALVEAARIEGYEQAKKEMEMERLKKAEERKLAAEEKAVSQKIEKDKMTAAEQEALAEKMKEWEKEKDASKLIIRSVSVEKMPMTKHSGAGWDTEDGPDVALAVTIPDGSRMIKVMDKVMRDVNMSSFPLVWSGSEKVEIEAADFQKTFQIEVMDMDDEEADESISSLFFSPSTFIREYDEGGKSKRIRLKYYDLDALLTNKNGDLVVRLKMDWK